MVGKIDAKFENILKDTIATHISVIMSEQLKITNHRFIITGFEKIVEGKGLYELNQYKSYIKNLGGICLDCSTDQFILSCTHILCLEFNSSVKIMGGLASGKWIVGADYIKNSYRNKNWLSEDEYERSDFNKVAEYCRLRCAQNGPLFKAYNFYLETKANTKVYKRVLLAGGASVLSKPEVVNSKHRVHLAICDEASYQSVKETVGHTVPILNLEYMKATIFQKHSPKDIWPFLINKKQTIPTGLTLDSSSEEAVKNVEADEFLQKCTLSPRIVKRTKGRSQLRNSCHGNILPYLVKTDGRDCKYVLLDDSPIKRVKTDYSYNTDEIEVLQEIKCNEIPKPVPVLIVIDNEDVEKETAIRHDNLKTDTVLAVSSSQDISDNADKVQMSSDSNEGFTLHSLSRDSSVVQDTSSTVRDDQQANTDSSKNYVSDATSVDIMDKSTTVRETQFGNERKCIIEPIQLEISATGHESKFTQEEHIVLQPKSERDTQSEKGTLMRRDYIIEPQLNDITGILSKFLIRINSSFYLHLNCLITFPKYVPYLVHATNNTNNSNMLSGGTKLVAKSVELKPKDSQVYISLIKSDYMKITTEKVGRYKCPVAVENNKSSYHEDDIMVDMVTLQWLGCRIQRTSYPSAQVIGEMIKAHIVFCPVRQVKNRALNVFGNLVSLHPPHNRNMRDYYVRVFSSASPEQNEHNRVWGFVRSIVEEVLAASSLVGQSKTSAGPNMSLLVLILSVLEMDLLYYNERPVSVRTLLSYHLFWMRRTDKPSVVNQAVRELVRLWMLSLEADRVVRRLISRLLSIMLDLIWKWNEKTDPLFVCEWPLSRNWKPVVNEIYIRFREYSNVTPLLQFLELFETPWQKLLMSSLMYRASDPNDSSSKVTLSFINDKILQNVKKCKERMAVKSDGAEPETPHAAIMELLALMYTSYIETTGATYCKMALRRHAVNMIRQRRVREFDMPHEQSANCPAIESGCELNLSCEIRDDSSKENHKRKYLPEAVFSDPIFNAESQQAAEESRTGQTEVPNIATMEMVDRTILMFRDLKLYSKDLRYAEVKCSHLKKFSIHDLQTHY